MNCTIMNLHRNDHTVMTRTVMTRTVMNPYFTVMNCTIMNLHRNDPRCNGLHRNDLHHTIVNLYCTVNEHAPL